MTLWFAATRICCEGVKIDVGMELSRRDPELTVVCKSFRIPYDEIHEVTSREIYNHFFQRAAVAPLSHGNMFNNYFISTGRVGIDVKSSNSPAFMSAAQYERSAR